MKHICYLIRIHHSGRETRRKKDVACWINLSENDDNLNTVSSKCTSGKSSISRKTGIQKKKKKKKGNFLKSTHLDFKFDLGKLNNKTFPHTVQC